MAAVPMGHAMRSTGRVLVLTRTGLATAGSDQLILMRTFRTVVGPASSPRLDSCDRATHPSDLDSCDPSRRRAPSRPNLGTADSPTTVRLDSCG